MWLFLCTLAVCFTVDRIVRFLVTSKVSFRLPSLQVAVTAAPAVAPALAGDAPEAATFPRFPRDILELCARDSEQFMREKNLADAHTLYLTHYAEYDNDEDRFAAVRVAMQGKLGEEMEPTVEETE